MSKDQEDAAVPLKKQTPGFHCNGSATVLTQQPDFDIPTRILTFTGQSACLISCLEQSARYTGPRLMQTERRK